MSAEAIAAAKAATLIEALPYIRSYRGETVVVKVGGEALNDPALAPLVAEDMALLALVGIRLIVVHGGGPQVSAAMLQAGVEPRFVGGLRVTDDASMELVRQVLVGSINSDLVDGLCRSGLEAVGLSGTDAHLLHAVRTTGPRGEDLGRVGRVVDVNAGLLHALMDDGYTPVIASVASGDDGDALNVNADSVAGAVAAGMTASKLVYLTSVEGLYRDLGDEGSLVSEIKLGEIKGMLEGLSAGMHPKAASAIEALESGVGKVHILDGRVKHALLLEIFTEKGIGTQVLP